MTEQLETEDHVIEEVEATEGAEGADDGGRTKGERRKANFQGSAMQAIQRARKSTSGDSDEVTPRATLLVGSAIAFALLDLADAVRSHGQADTPEE